MPIYEYECKVCGKFEVLQKISEAPIERCETCGGDVHRLVSLSSFALVGGGWYKDLYSSTSSSVGTQSTEAKPASSEKKPEAKPSTAAA